MRCSAPHTRIWTCLMAIAMAAAVTPAGIAAETVPRPLGKLQILSGPSACGPQRCYQFEVTCPQVAKAERGRLKVGDPEGPSRGTILLASGGVGTQLVEGRSQPVSTSEQQGITADLLKAGFRTVQVAWENGVADRLARRKRGVGATGLQAGDRGLVGIRQPYRSREGLLCGRRIGRGWPGELHAYPLWAQEGFVAGGSHRGFLDGTRRCRLPGK